MTPPWIATQQQDLESSQEAMARDGGLAPRLKARIEILRENFSGRLLRRIERDLAANHKPPEDE